MSYQASGTDQKRDRFTSAMFFRAWWPALLSSIGWSLSDIADAVVVGRHLGTVGLASISLILPVYMINCLFAHGLGTGGSMQYAFLMARGFRTEARKNVTGIYAAGLLFSGATAVLGLVFLHPLLHILGTVPADGALFEATRAYLRIQLLATPLFYLSNIFNYYLRNDGMDRIAGIGSVTGNLCDIALNFVLVLGLQMGTGGAALATALGQIISIGIYLPGLLRRDHGIRPGLPAAGWLRDSLGRLRRGMSVSVQYLYQMIFLLLCNNLLMRIGGETGIAVFDVLQNTSYLILYLYEGTARAMQPVASTYYGESNGPGLRNLYRTGFAAGAAAGSFLILTAICRPDLVCLLFGLTDSAVLALACTAIRIFAAGAFFGGLSILFCNYLQARGLESYAFWLETLRGAVILIPAALVCSLGGLRSFWWLFPVTEISSLAIVVTWIRIRRSALLFRMPLAEDRIFRRTILSSSSDIGQASMDLEDFCDRFHAAPRQRYTVMLTVEEVGMAILKHGFMEDDSGYIQITVLALQEGLFELHLRDNALTFDPFSLRGGSVLESDDLDATGILLIRKRTRDFSYRRFQGFNTLVIKV